MNIKEYLNQVAYIGPSKIEGFESETYYSLFDGSYITLVGMEDKVQFLADREITEQLQHGIGFSPKEEKWYGWSHRAIYGFGVGSTCKKGDCHYTANNPEEMIDDYANFFADISRESAQRRREECSILPDRSGIRIMHRPITLRCAPDIAAAVAIVAGEADIADQPEVTPNTDNFTEQKCGRGEWTAATLDDAKEMAIAFNAAVS